MKDLRATKINSKTNSFNFKKLKEFVKKNKFKIIIITIIIFIIIFPKLSGSIIGTWITKFVGTLIENIKI